jgi:PBP1b-binding outer membrane lipoprotein LpoB
MLLSLALVGCKTEEQKDAEKHDAELRKRTDLLAIPTKPMP